MMTMTTHIQARCDFCYHRCTIPEGRAGLCGVRICSGGKIITRGYGRLVACAVDPVEKKPLYHFLPGSTSLSVAMAGCNYICGFCQNYAISQREFTMADAESRPFIEPGRLVEMAKLQSCASISFTYSEPTAWQDYMCATALRAHEKDVRTVMVTNGSWSAEARERLFPVIDAFNIDVKGDEDYYRTVCGGSLVPVMENVRATVRHGAHLEVTTMVVEGIHTPAFIREIGMELKDAGVNVWHISRFFPQYRMSGRPPTSEGFLAAILSLAEESGIPYVYAGNSRRQDATVCPKCGSLLMSGHGYGGEAGRSCVKTIVHGRCITCGEKIYGIFS